MGGIPKKAIGRNLTIEGTNYTVDEAADLTGKRNCGWQPGFVTGTKVNAAGTGLHPAAVAYYDSVARLYKQWGIDFIKMDCVFGGDYRRGALDFAQFSASMQKVGQPFLFSLSPGSSVAMAPKGLTFATARAATGGPLLPPTMARMTGDFWDSWSAAKGHFATAANSTAFVSDDFYPDLDMLPLGWIAPFEQPQRFSKFTFAEAQSLMTLMVMARAPLIWGGTANETMANATTLSLISNPAVLNVSLNSCVNVQVSRTTTTTAAATAAETSSSSSNSSSSNVNVTPPSLSLSLSLSSPPPPPPPADLIVWAAQGRDPGTKYVALINVGETAGTASLNLTATAVPGPPLLQRGQQQHRNTAGLTAIDLWTGATHPVVDGVVEALLQPHASKLLLVKA